MMRFSVYANPQTRGPDDDERVIEYMTQHTLAADRAGFESVLLTDHHFIDYNTYGNSFLYGAYLAPQLERLHIVLSVAIPGLMDPVTFAEHANLLDQLTKGRVIVGVGSGSSPVEFIGLGRDPQNRHALMNEALDTVEKLWDHRAEDPPLEFKTTHAHGQMVGRINPAPYRKARPHMARAALSDDGIVDAARRGWSLVTGRAPAAEIGRRFALYRETLASSGHDAATVERCTRFSAVQKMIWVADSYERARAEIEPALDEYEACFKKAFPPSLGAQGARGDVDGPARRQNAETVGVAVADRDAFIRGAMIIGSPDDVAAGLEEYAAAGVDHVACHFYFGAADPELTTQSFERFVADVVPRLTDASSA